MFRGAKKKIAIKTNNEKGAVIDHNQIKDHHPYHWTMQNLLSQTLAFWPDKGTEYKKNVQK